MKMLFACIVLAACGSSAPAPAQPSSGPQAEAALPDVPFDNLNHEQKAQYMKQKVVPAMTPVFQNHDAKDFAQFGCETCHGKDASARHFEMPNPELPKLVMKELMAGTSKFKPEDIEWMHKEVAPTMAKLVQMQPWSPDNPKGFGCASCHPVEE
jgi:hypothetical protein